MAESQINVLHKANEDSHLNILSLKAPIDLEFYFSVIAVILLKHL